MQTALASRTAAILLTSLALPSRISHQFETITPDRIQHAIDSAPANSIVRIPKGIYIVDKPIVIQRDNISIEGSGSETVFVLANNTNRPLFVIGSPETTNSYQTPFRVSNITLSKMVLDGNSANQQHEVLSGDIEGAIEIRNNCLTIRGAENVNINDIVTKNARSGGVVLEKTCRNIQINGLESYGNFFDGVAAYETYGSTFTNMNLHSNNAAGISVDIRFNNNTISDSTIRNNGSQAIFMRDSCSNRFVNLNILENQKHGVFLANAEAPGLDCKDNIFINTTIQGSKLEGFRINDATCTGNIIDPSCTIINNKEGNISIAQGLSHPVTSITLR